MLAYPCFAQGLARESGRGEELTPEVRGWSEWGEEEGELTPEVRGWPE